MKLVIVSGGFDPLHSGHIKYLEAAKQLGDALFVGLNSDEWLKRKKGNYFMNWDERYAVLQAIRPVDWVLPFDDRDGSALDLLRQIRSVCPTGHMIVANGGDRNALNNAEAAFDDPNCEFVYGVGGSEKVNSSSFILKRWNDFIMDQWMKS